MDGRTLTQQNNSEWWNSKQSSLTRAAVGCTNLKNMLRDWEEENNMVLDKEIATHLKDDTVSCAKNIYQLASTAQSIQMSHKVTKQFA